MSEPSLSAARAPSAPDDVVRVIDALGAEGGDVVYLLDRDLRIVHVTGDPPPGDLPLARADEVLRTRRPVRDEVDDGTRCYQVVLTPLLDGGGEVERIIAVARDVTAQRRAAAAMARLQQLTMALASSMSEGDVAEIVIRQAHDHLGAAISVAYFADDAGILHLAAARNLPVEVSTRLAMLPPDAPLPLAQAIRSGEPVWLENRAALLAAFPHLAATSTPAHVLMAVAAVPLVFEGRTIGGAAFSFASEQTFDGSVRDFMRTLAAQCAQAVVRARLYERERRAHARLTILAEASARFAHAEQDLTAALDTITTEVGTRLPDSCAISLVGSDGRTLDLAALYHPDPVARESVYRTLAATPVHVGDRTTPGRVAATGEAVLIPVVPPSLAAESQPEHRAHLERFPLRSLMVVPVASQDRVLGVIIAARGDGPPFTEEDLSLLSELAARAAPVIENARLVADLRRNVRFADEFVGILGHDLRNPLNAIALTTESMVETSGDPALGRPLGRIRASVDRMARMVDQLLDLTRARLGGGIPVSPSATDLGALARMVVEELEVGATQAIETVVLGDAAGRWDPDRLFQVLSNLIGNAATHGDAGAAILVTIDGRAPDRVQIRVDSRGVIDAETMPDLFEPFRAGRRGGSSLGLGLHIAQQIVVAHGGAMTAHCQGGITTFDVTLPRR